MLVVQVAEHPEFGPRKWPMGNVWGQGVDSVSYPGPSIHPIMSLKIYILLYIYVITME